MSAFGGIVGLNRPVDAETAGRMAEPGRFLECILAPEFTPEAFEILTTRPSWKHSVRLVELNAPLGPGSPTPVGYDFRRIEGGLLVQGWDAIGSIPSGKIVRRSGPRRILSGPTSISRGGSLRR